MFFSSGFWGALLTNSGKWHAYLDDDEFVFVSTRAESCDLSYTSIFNIRVTPGVMWSEVAIDAGDRSLTFDGIGNSQATFLKQQLESHVADSLLESIEPHRRSISNLIRSLKALLGKERYLSNFDIASWANKQEARIGEPARAVLAAIKHPLFPLQRVDGGLRRQTDLLMDVLRGQSQLVVERNEKFLQAEMLAYKEFFDCVEVTPLTTEQRRAAIVMEDRNLLIAAAGSGKTSSVVGKVGYALLREYVAPREVLVLAFNNHAAKELEERINRRLSKFLVDSNVRVKTFHALGLEIIADVENAKPSVPDFAADSGGGRKLVGELIEHLISADISFARDWVLFRAVFLRSAKDPAQFSSASEWREYVKETGDYINGSNGYQSLNGELVKSQGELAIANWLYMNSVSYHYEKPYKYRTANKQYRQYHPDFYFPDIDCYLEHYALDEDGNPPPAFGDKYLQSMEWKRALHLENSTDVFETYFSEFVSDVLFEKLQTELTSRGVKLQPRSPEEILERINQHQGAQTNEFYGLIVTFLKHAKSNQVSQEALERSAREHSQVARATLFVRLFCKILDLYSKKLRETGSVDFEDMIIKAAQYALDGRYRHPYQLILVDEFQDISQARGDLLKGLLKHTTSCKMFAVGDDWQSIYRFAGSDVSLFTSFEEQFGVTATNYLTRTFRSNQGIADVAAKFVQQNPNQIPKSVVAVDPLKDQVVSIRKVERRNDVNGHIVSCLDELATAAQTSNEIRSVYFLARYRHQRPESLPEWRESYAASLTLDFKTVHSSKGLQADYVILLGLQGGKLGFPSMIADDPLLGLVMPSPEAYLHAEERRLFYVALTRARRGVYLLASKFVPSKFVTELEADSDYSAMLKHSEVQELTEDGVAAETCPNCGRGRLRLKSGKYGEFWGCSEYPSCSYTRDNSGVSKRFRSRTARR